MSDIRIIADAKSVAAYLDGLRGRGVGEIALDLEADQGSYRYRYSVSIIQCFDGEETVIIDVLALGRETEGLAALLEAPDIAKVMFSSKNDLFIVQNVLGCGIRPIRDVAVAQKLLGLKVDLASYLGIEKSAKDGFQRANWLKRPITRKLLEYAAGDVERLLSIETGFRQELAEKGLDERYRQACALLPASDYRVDQYRMYERKFPGYPRLSPEKKKAARLVWVFRELIGERFDSPVGYIISTKRLPAVLAGPEDALAARLEEALNEGRRPERRLSASLVAQALEEARRAVAENRHAPGSATR